MESLSQSVETIAIPLVISVPTYLRDHDIDGFAVLPAVEALQIVARSRENFPSPGGRGLRGGGRPDGLDQYSFRQERAIFHHPLVIDASTAEIQAVHEHVRYADGRCHSRLTTLRSGRQMKFTRRMEHLSVWFVPEDRADADCGDGCETDFPSDPGDAILHAGPMFRVSADRLYAELVPFGPAYRNVRDDVFLTETFISATVSGGDFREAAGPLGSPFPLDAAMHAACVWGQRYRNRVVFPIGFDRREILSPTRIGETYLCRIMPLPDEGAVLCFDVGLQDLQRRPVETILGLKMREIFGGKRIPPTWVREGLSGCA